MKQIKRPKNKKPILLATFLGIVAIVLIYVGVAYAIHLPPFASTKKDPIATGEHTVNMEKSETEKKTETDLKQNPDKKTDQSGVDVPEQPKTDPSTGKQQVQVLITSAGVINRQVDARGSVMNLAEDGGTCTFTFTMNGTTVQKTSGTLPGGPTSTSCKSVQFSQDELSVGTWQVVLEYTSSTSYGKSSATSLEVK